MLTGDNGILTQAQNAKEETEKASVIEQAQTDILGIQASGDTTLTQKQLRDVLTKYFSLVPYDVNTNDILTTKEEYGGKYQVAVSDIYSGELKEVVSIPEGLEIGSTVYYDPNGTFPGENEINSLSVTYSGINSNLEKLDSSTNEFNINTWRIFDIDEINGKIKLIPIHSTDLSGGYISLKGAQGYNNGVKILNDVCNALYGDDAKGITARSINIDDIEGKMTDDALDEAHNLSNTGGPKWGEQVANAYSLDSYYPSIYEQEKLNGVNGTQSSSGLEMSDEANSLIEPTENSATGGLLHRTGIRPTQTYWFEGNSFMKNAFEISINGTNYYNLLIPDDTSTNYWVASRCVNVHSEFCNFHLGSIIEGKMDARNMFYSGGNGNVYYYSLGLFPIVSISYEHIAENTTGEFLVK